MPEDVKYESGDLVLIIDNYYNVTGDNATCLILDRVNPFEFLGLPDDVFLDDDPKIKEVYKIFLACLWMLSSVGRAADS